MQNKAFEILSKFEIFGVCRFCELPKPFDVRCASRLMDDAKSVITFLFPYRTEFNGERNLSLYCIGKDYHDIIISKLKDACSELKNAYPEHKFEPFCDISPINEVCAAYLSGLGFLGKNGLIINEKYGSYCFIGEIVTNLEFESYATALKSCLDCSLCLKSCPGGALKNTGGKTFFLDTSRCLSYITQKKGKLLSEETEAIKNGGLIWGCDICSEVCPMNKDAAFSNIPEFSQNLMPLLNEENIKDSKDRAYGYKGTTILKRNLGIIYGKDENNIIK